MLWCCFGRRSLSLFCVDRFLVVSSTCTFRRHGHGHGHARRSSSRFKWPHAAFMPSRTPYQMFPAISTPDEAEEVVSHLTKGERLLLRTQLEKLKDEKDVQGLPQLIVQPVTTSQLYSAFLVNCLPFVGFGLLDNAIMIIAGEYINITIGTALNISIMAAAALGNLVSDVAGVGCTSYIELLVSKVGVTPPNMTVEQSQTTAVRWTVNAGRVIGITVGCLLGMFPLLFYDSDNESSSSSSTSSSSSPSSPISSAAAADVVSSQ